MRPRSPLSAAANERNPAGVSRAESGASELGSYDTRPVGCSIDICPSRCWLANGHFGALIGSWWKLGEPKRDSWVSRYENSRPCSSGSFEKSMPGTRCDGQNATCSVSAKKLLGQRSSTMRPITFKGTSSSGISFVGSRWSKGNLAASASENSCTANSHSGKLPAWIASKRSRRWKSGSAPAILTVSSHTVDCKPSFGRQWNLTKVESPASLRSRKLWMPKPSIMRSERGSVRSDMAHITMCMASGVSEMKSQKVSCALAACGKPRSGSIFTAWMRSGNLIASWMKKTGMLLPTRSQLPCCVYSLTAKPRTSRGVSDEPEPPATVEKRANSGVRTPTSVSTLALVTPASDAVSSK